jgi:CDP-6-deoxy-D-xylo-4-hexulose-3-dehydrase
MTSKKLKNNIHVKLVEDTINKQDINELIKWLKTNPILTKKDRTLEFEDVFAKWLGVKYAVFVNSGSSANLLAMYSLMLDSRLKNKKIIVPAISWATTVAPAIQLGLEPIMCDCNMDDLGLDINSLEVLFKKHNPGMLILVHVLGFSCSDITKIKKLCKQYNVFLIEDTCESFGSSFNNKKLGTYGDFSTFSFFYGHHFSTIEGGMVCTNDSNLRDIMVSVRSHGWDRDLQQTTQKKLRKKYNVDDFSALYTFYYPGYNMRSTDLQAKIGLIQMKKVNYIVEQRNKNYLYYQKNINNPFWKVNPLKQSFVSNFCYPIITPRKNELVKALKENNIECRPLICGSIGLQPFWINRYGKCSLPNADTVSKNGLYVPNNHTITTKKLDKVISVVNNILN